jgi:hypothetical protein
MDGFMKDSKGRMVPEEMVRPIDKARDELVRDILTNAMTVARGLSLFKQRALGDVKAFVELSAEQYGVRLGGQKGNITLTSYDGEYKILIAVDERITFDERLQAAKALIDACFREWTKDSPAELKVIVDDAFAVDKAGKINTNRVLSLRRLPIENEKWKKAMEAISDSITVAESKEYIRIYRRNDKGKYDLINLDIAA